MESRRIDEQYHLAPSYNFFNDHSFNYHNINYYLPARAEVVRVIPYPRNKDLVYRRDLFDQLDRLLPRTLGFYSAALWGSGGSGKTQIALNYAYQRYDNGDCCVFWVHADSEATFVSDYKTIGKKLGVDEKLNGSALLDAVRSSIEAQSRWVIILDNADDLGLFGVGHTEGTNKSLSIYLPQGSQGTILWTSRDAHILGTLVGSRRGIEVPSMTRDEATALLATARGEKSAVEELGLDHLLEELGRLPLAVSQAGAYMRRTSLTIKEYLDLLMQGTSRWDLLNMNDFDRHRRPDVSNSVLEMWKISTERIREENELSYRILHVIAYLDSQDIPLELMMAASKYSVGDEDRGRQVTEFEVQQAVIRLVEFSFLNMRRVEEGWRSYEMHKFVQEAVRYGLWAQGPLEPVLDKTTAWESITENKEAYYSSMALRVVDNIFPASEKNPWVQCEQYVNHAIRVGEWAGINGKKVETSALLSRVSNFLYDRGRWREKEPVNWRSFNLRQEVLGEKHPDTITSMADLASTYHTQGRYDEDEDISVKVLDLRREVLGEKKHPHTIMNMADLATTYLEQGRYDEAEILHKQALNLRREVLGEKHPHTIMSMADLASTYHAQARYDEAEILHKQALNLRREVLGEKHPHTIMSMADLATYHAQRRCEQKPRRRTLREVIHVKARIFKRWGFEKGK